MCTVSYIPLGKNQFVLTSNRDESPKRSPKIISTESTGSMELIFPKDIKGGTWICASSQNKLLCLLNGAFTRHQHRPPYPKSRGIIVKDCIQYKDIRSFHKEYDLTGIEPFTMVVWENGELFQFRRDEHESYLTPLDTESAYIWSSSTLYEQAAKIKRQGWFDEWKEQQTYTPESILQLHKEGGDGDIFNDFVMDRHNIVRTVSITQVVNDGHSMTMEYNDLLHLNQDKQQLSLSKLMAEDVE